MKDREDFLKEQITDFNAKIAHFKGLELRWNEGGYNRVRGGHGRYVGSIRPYDVGLDLVKLPTYNDENEDINQPVIEIPPEPQPPGIVDES